MKLAFKKCVVLLSVVCLLATTIQIHAFALLGPIQPWMQAGYGIIQPGDIGGPMDIGSGYRWNVPVITYGFDKSFLNYFGTNGVTAVENAIQMLNSLPPASGIVLNNFPLATKNYNYTAQTQGLYGLEPQTLSLLLEQLGLAQPERNIFLLKQWTTLAQQDASNDGISPNAPLIEFDWQDWAIPDFIANRNFDPQTLTASQYVNGTLYTADIFNWNSSNPNMVWYSSDPFADTYSSATDAGVKLGAGGYFTGLTYDDVGGVCYLLSTNTINYETLLSGITGVGPNSNSFVNGAWRPGVDKITFVPQPVDPLSGMFLSMTNQFTDTYITNGNAIQQQVQRVMMQPDILFTVADTGNSSPATDYYVRTSTTNWINNANANGNTNGEGPGVIQPPVQISFNKLENIFVGGFSDEEVGGGANPWGSFDGSTNAPIIYPIPQTGTNQMTVRMWLEKGTYPTWSTISFKWTPTNAIGTSFTFQTSSNLLTWVNLFTVTNDGTVCTYLNENPKSPSRFYRLFPLTQ